MAAPTPAWRTLRQSSALTLLRRHRPLPSPPTSARCGAGVTADNVEPPSVTHLGSRATWRGHCGGYAHGDCYRRHGVVLLRWGDLQATSSDGANSMAVLNIGFSKGVATWEFRLDEDSRGGECTCFGAVTKPLVDFNYSSSSSFMYRCYNGQLYGRGSASNKEKVRRTRRRATHRFRTTASGQCSRSAVAVAVAVPCWCCRSIQVIGSGSSTMPTRAR